MKKNIKTLLWLDDVRDPMDKDIDWLVFSPIGRNVDIHWITSYKEFINWITINGLPNAICFDHDLGDEESGYDCSKWLVRYHQTFGGTFPIFASQSANPIGRKNILTYLKNYLKHVTT